MVQSPQEALPAQFARLKRWASHPTSERFGKVLFALAWGALLFMVLYGASINALWDNDIYFIIATGRDIVANGITAVEPLTMHDGLEYIAQQWLVCVVDAVLYDGLGKWAVEAFHVAVWAAALVVLGRLVYELSGKRSLVTLSIMLATLLVTVGWIRTNPRGFDLLFLALSIVSVREYAKSPCSRLDAGRYFAQQLAMALVLVNVHAALWSILLFAPLAYCVPTARAKQARLILVLLAAPLVAVVIAASLFNPYGRGEVLGYVFASLGSNSFDYFQIAEMQPMSIGAVSNNLTMLLPIAFVALLASNRKAQGRLTEDEMAMALLDMGTYFMALWAVRNEPLAAFAAALAFATQLRHVDFSRRLRWARPAALVSSALCCALIVPMGYAAVQLGNVERYPDRSAAVDALFGAGVKEGDEIIASFNDGGYCEFRGLRPYIDARAEVFVPELNGGRDIADEWHSVFIAETVSLSEFASRYDFDAALVQSERYDARSQLEEAGFKIVYDDNGYLAGVRSR